MQVRMARNDFALGLDEHAAAKSNTAKTSNQMSQLNSHVKANVPVQDSANLAHDDIDLVATCSKAIIILELFRKQTVIGDLLLYANLALIKRNNKGQQTPKDPQF